MYRDTVPPETSSVLFLDGRHGNYVVYTLMDDNRRPYCYRQLSTGLISRVYLKPGESVQWIEDK
jgi:hypothetical protein